MNITPFSFDQHPVRVIDRDGQPWFVATDIAEALEYRDATNMVRNLDDDEADTHIVSTRSDNGIEQDREVTIINESGLYSAILRSRKASAKRFKKWVTSEVLPAIRKTGAYVAPAKPERKGKQKALPGALTVDQRDAVQALVLARVRACDKQLQGAAAMKLWSIIKSKFGCSYKEIPTEQFPEVLSLVARQDLEGELLPAEPAPQPTPAAVINMPLEWLFEHNPRLNRERPLVMRPHGLLLTMGTLGTIDHSAIDHLLNQLTKLGADVAAPRAEAEAWRHFAAKMFATAAMLTDQTKRMADHFNQTLGIGFTVDRQNGRPR
jgi:prophage antirepressor-like protein